MRTLHLVSHTHWDREWYRPFQEFRLRLVHLVDGLLEILDSDPRYRHFMLDGQTVVLDDYLLIRPENEEKIRRYVRQGRIAIGPWHILPDEFLVGPEATVRNLLEGAKSCARFGPRMPVGYIPDPFGHIGQMPQILQGFGIQAAAFRRGLSDEPVELWWEAPDGSRVFVSYLRDGYDNAASLPTANPAHFVSEVRRLRDSLLPHSASDHLLLLQGTDHMEPPPETPRAVAFAKGKLDGDLLVHSTLAEYLKAAQASVKRKQLPVIHGDLRDPKRHHLLPGCISARMWIKQRNHASETLLEKWAEPFSMFAGLTTVDRGRSTVHGPRSIVHAAWRLLMENHPHDSICGCSVDQVHDEMKVRFDQVDQIGEELVRQSLATIAARVDTGPASDDTIAAVVVFNAASAPRTDLASARVELPHGSGGIQMIDDKGQVVPHQTVGLGGRDLIHVTMSAKELLSAFGSVSDGHVSGQVIQGIQVRREGSQVFIDVALSDHGDPDQTAWKAARAQIDGYVVDPSVTDYHVHARSADAAELQFTAPDVPGLGWRAFRVRRLPAADKAPVRLSPLVRLLLPLARLPFVQKLAARPRAARRPYRIENEFLSVEADRDGTVTLLDKRDGRRYPGLNRFLDGGDCGDEYNYAPPVADLEAGARLRRVTLARGPVQQMLTLELDLKTPVALAADRQSRSKERTSIPIVTRLTLTHGVPRLDVHTTVDNSARDHRLRVHFPAPFAAASAHHDGHFQVVERPIGASPSTSSGQAFDGGWIEQPRPEVPQRAFTCVSDGISGLTVANRGLPEVEVSKNPSGHAGIALTLLRCVGWLSRDDFSTRKGHAGPFMETPGAQMQGTWTFEYSVIPHSGNWQGGLVQAYAFDTPLRSAVTGLHLGSLPASGAFVSVAPDTFVLSAAKEAEDGRGWILRGYDVTGLETKVSLRPWRAFRKVTRVGLAEQRLAALKPGRDGNLAIRARGHEVVSVKFEA